MNNVAGIGSKQLQETLIDTAVALGKIKKGEVTLENFGTSLKKGWADRDVLEAGFGRFASAMEEAYKLVKEGKFETAAAALDSLEGNWDELSVTASKAAQNAKTFKEVIDYTADAMSSNWMSIWEAIFGNFEQARDLWSNLAEVVYEHFVAPLEHFRDRVVAIMNFNPFSSIMEKIENSGIGKIAKKVEGVADSINNVSRSLEYYQDMVNKIWRGDYKNQPYRKGLLEAEGHNFEVLQSLVNKGYQYKLTVDDIAAAEKKYGIEAINTTDSINDLKESLEDLTDEKLKDAGLTEEEIKLYRKAEKEAKKHGKTISEVFEEWSKMTGRDLLIGSFANLGSALLTIFESIKRAWREVFPEKTELELYSILQSLYNFTNGIREHIERIAADTEEKLSPLTRTLRGLFSIIHIITTAIKTVFRAAFKILEGVLSVFNISILDITAAIGDFIYNIDRWLTENNAFVEALKNIGIFIGTVIKKIIEWIQHNEKIMFVINKIKEAFENSGNAIKAWFEGLKETKNVPEYIFGGLINGIKEHGPKVFEAIGEVAKGLINTFCKILGIHSPSKVMYAIGGFLVLGLIAGMESQSISLWELLQGIGNHIIDMFKQLDLGNIIAIGMSSGIVYIAKRMLDIADDLLGPLRGLTSIMNGLGSALSGIGTAAKDFGKSMKYQGVAAIIKSIAISIGVLAASLFVLAKLPADQLKQGAIALGFIVAILYIFIKLVSNLSDKLSQVKLPDIGKTLAVVLGISFGMVIMAKALKSVSKIQPDRMVSAIFGLIACAAAMVILIVALAKVSTSLNQVENIKKMGNMFLKMALSMLLIAVALKMMAKVEWSDVGKMGAVVLGIVALLGSIALINKFTENSMLGSAEILKAVGVTLLLLVVAMKLCGKLHPADFLKALGVIGLFIGLLTAMMVISKIFKETEMVKVTGSILMAAVAIGILALITKLLSNMDPEAMKKGLKCIGILSTIVIALIAVSRNSTSFHGSTLIGVAIVIAAMGVMVFLLGQLDPEKAKNGLVAVGWISAFVAVLLKAARNFNPGANAIKTLSTLTFMLALLAVALVALSFIDQTKLMKTAGSLGAVMLALAAVIAATSKMKIDKGVVKTLLTIALVIGLMAIVLGVLSNFTDPDGLLETAGALSLLLIACGGLVTILSHFNVDAKKAVKGALALTSMAIPLLAFTGILKLMQSVNLKTSLKNVMALTLLAGAMTGLLAALGLIANFGIQNIAVGVLGLTLMAIPLLAFVGILKLMDNVNKAMENVLALTLLASAMTLLLIPLSLLGALVVGSGGIGALAIAAGIIALTAMAVPLLAFIGVLSVMSGIENAESNAEALTTMAEKLTNMLIKISLVAPLAILADVALAGLLGIIAVIGVVAVAVGALMEKFPKLQEFLDKGLPILEQIAFSIGKIFGNIVAGFTNSIANELPHLGSKLSEFMEKADGFFKGSVNIPDNLGDKLGSLALGIIALTGSNLIDSIATFLSGGVSFSELGKELSTFATNSEDFLKIMSNVDTNVLEGAESLAKAVLALTASNLIDSLTKSIKGSNDFGEFAKKIPELAKGLKSFSENLGDFPQKDIDAAKRGMEVLKAIVEVAKTIPDSGGFISWVAGDNDIATFAAKLGGVAASIRGFLWELNKDYDFGDDQVTTAQKGMEALKAVVDVANSIGNTGGLVSFFAGDNDIEKFAAKLGNVGRSLRGMIWELNKDNVINDESIDKVHAVCSLLYALAALSQTNLGDASSKIEEFGARLGSFANKLTEYIKTINTISYDDLSSNKEKIDKIIEIVKNLAETNTDGIEQLGEKLKNFATDAINKFIEGLNDEQYKKKASDAIISFIGTIISAADEKKSDVKNKFNEIGEELYQGLNWDNNRGQFRYFSFQDLGKNFVDGFIDGIAKNSYLAKHAGTLIGEKALNGLQESIDAHSPSRESYKLGSFFDDGFINGVKSLSDKIYAETYGVGDRARLGLSRAIKGVSNLISEGVDDEFTIRPILDLSNIESGAAAINGMFNTPSLGVSANLNAISSGMRMIQTNKEDNVISAIDRLSKNLGNTNGDTYNINGITYENGTEVSEAVQTLVRAARIERRT